MNLMVQKNDNPEVITGIHYETGKPVRIDIHNGKIADIAETDLKQTEDMSQFIAPGLFDNQINGYAGVDFTGDSLTSDGVIDAVKDVWSDGVTSFLPTVTTSSHERLVKNFSVLHEALVKDEYTALSIPGFHLEGPYISPEEGYRGTHPVKYIRKPSINEFNDYQKAAGGKIIQVTLAPELEGAGNFIESCVQKGIVIAMGHTRSGSEEISAAVKRGARLSTHLGNGCANYIHRHYNPIWPQLANEMIVPTIIADGIHLLPEELKVFLKVKGPENLILTSDIVFIAGMKPGRYILFESEVELTPGGMLRNIEMNCLAGASYPLKAGVANMMKFTGCSMKEAINMATANVARVYGLDDRGSITTGKRADLILFEKEADKIIIRKTYLNGRLVFEAPASPLTPHTSLLTPHS